MEGVKNRADVECAESETVRTRIQFNVAGKQKKGKNRRTQEAPGAVTDEVITKVNLTVFLTYGVLYIAE